MGWVVFPILLLSWRVLYMRFLLNALVVVEFNVQSQLMHGWGYPLNRYQYNSAGRSEEKILDRGKTHYQNSILRQNADLLSYQSDVTTSVFIKNKQLN